MNSGNHTPGPWAVDSTPESTNQEAIVFHPYPFEVNRQDNAVASIYYQHLDGAAEANACLIAAAPELLEALHGALNNATGLAAYLATCATSTILENLETTIAGLHREAANYEAAIRKARGIAV